MGDGGEVELLTQVDHHKEPETTQMTLNKHTTMTFTFYYVG